MSARCARLADSTAFNLAIFAVILANAVVLGLETYDSVVEDAGGLLDALNAAFLAVFVVELAIRIAAHGSRPQDFFRDGWNVFDFVIVAVALAPIGGSNSALLRLARLARVLRVVRILPELRLLVVAVGRSLPGVASLAVLGILVLFVYGMVGWLAFGDQFPDDWGNIGDAMLTLFVLLSLESLPDMIDQGLEVSQWSLVYYVSFVLVASFLLLNILIGVVIDSLDKAREMEFTRAQADRRAAAAGTEGEGDDAAVELLQHVHELRRTLENVEREARAVVRAQEHGRSVRT
ncbi:MAG TPA: ion transporter [Thermoleophilaceae bacterium]|nr:ion transporter [Thermoleophilaceae bacterium]